MFFFFFNDTATTEIYTLSLHDALPIWSLSQFKNKKALLVVTGLHEADFYIAKDGNLQKTGDFKLLNPHYSDKEGFFERSGHGRVLETGSVLETNKIEIRHRFLKGMDKILDSIVKRQKITDIYLFSPNFVVNELTQLLPKEDRKKIRYIFIGNYTHMHPFQLLAKIKDQERLGRSEEHTSELQSHSFISYAVFCLKKKKKSDI